MEIYGRLAAELLPTPAKSHYVFNLRDLSKCIQGVLQTSPVVVRDKASLARLFFHECSRVFHDRLVDEADRMLFFTMLSETASKYFNEVRRKFIKLGSLIISSVNLNLMP